ncbi:DUF2142 domain-containing protein [Xenophilus sp. Marseille-Q4582]|uniref:DUF2142 domain-containing protein n=1 Tax=Xenophilus sp. Marseille-Q4582 TaxID=2866600 RepID=UPI001CE3F193|nr:DUF2142 domain-containing protein [Xenophilus sp. Marseille-Q4582]
MTIWLALAATAVLIPPLQSPDEGGHLARAAMLAEGRLFMHAPPGRDSGSEFDANLVRFVVVGTSISGAPDATHGPAQKQELAALRWGGAPMFVEAPAMSYYLPLLYMPQALGLSLGQALDLSILQSYWLARGASWSACTLLLLLAWRVMPLSPLAVGLMLLPMTMFQMASPTLDGIVGCLSVCALAVFCRAYREQDWLTMPRALLWVCAIAALAAARTHLLPLLLLPFVLAWRHRRAREAWLGGAAAVLALGWVLAMLTLTRDTRIPRTHGSSELLAHYIRHPLDFLQVVWASLRDPVLGAGYAEGFVGRLGWLDTPLPSGSHDWLWLGLGLCACLSLGWTPQTGERRASELWARISLGLAAFASVLLTFLALLVTWTAQHPATHVDGIQGRYFLVPALMLAHALSGTAPEQCWRRRIAGAPVALLAVIAFGALSGWAIVAALVARYHFPFS